MSPPRPIYGPRKSHIADAADSAPEPPSRPANRRTSSEPDKQSRGEPPAGSIVHANTTHPWPRGKQIPAPSNDRKLRALVVSARSKGEFVFRSPPENCSATGSLVERGRQVSSPKKTPRRRL